MLENKAQNHQPLFDKLSPQVNEEKLKKFFVELAKWGIPASLITAFLAKIL